MSSGTPSARSARCSRKASIASSAQCRSSNTSTVGRSSAIPSRNLRQAVNSSSRSALDVASIPSSGSNRCRNHSRSSPVGQHGIELLLRHRGRIRLSRIPAWAFRISPSAQNVIPSPYGRQRPCRHVVNSGRPSMIGEQLGHETALPQPRLARPPSPAAPSSTPRSCRRRPSAAPGRSRGRRTACRACGSDPCRTEPSLLLAWKTRTGSDFPFKRRGLELLVVEHDRRRLVGRDARPRRPSPAPPTATATPY